VDKEGDGGSADTDVRTFL